MRLAGFRRLGLWWVIAVFVVAGVALIVFASRLRLGGFVIGVGLLIAAVAGEVLLFLLYRWTHNHALAASLLLPRLLLTVGATLVVLPAATLPKLVVPAGVTLKSS